MSDPLIRVVEEREALRKQLEAAEATLADVRAIVNRYASSISDAEEGLREIDRALSATPAPQHPDSELIDRIESVVGDWEVTDSSAAKRVCALLRTRVGGSLRTRTSGPRGGGNG